MQLVRPVFLRQVLGPGRDRLPSRLPLLSSPVQRVRSASLAPDPRPPRTRAHAATTTIITALSTPCNQSSRLFAHRGLLFSPLASGDELFDRWWRLVHGRETGRHTAVAEYSLAQCYGGGRPGHRPNPYEEFRWMQRAAARGHATAQAEVGKVHRVGLGGQVLLSGAPKNLGGVDPSVALHVTKDLDAAVAWFKKSAAQGNNLGMYWLGRAYYEGEGVPRDLQESVRWWETAARIGCVSSMFRLGNAQVPPPLSLSLSLSLSLFPSSFLLVGVGRGGGRAATCCDIDDMAILDNAGGTLPCVHHLMFRALYGADVHYVIAAGIMRETVYR